MDDPVRFYIAHTMQRYGGSFVQQLGGLLMRADPSNAVRLLIAFPELFEKYGPDSDFYAAIKKEFEDAL